MIIRTYDEKFRFYSAFDPSKGIYVRSNEFDADGKETPNDPFRGSFPHLLDIGIMGHCIHGASGKCIKSGVECYQNGRDISDANMSFEDFKSIIDESAGKTFQVALGGRGDPDMHENFVDIIRYCREKNVVPNFTTSGYGLDPAILPHVKENCGAVAVSWYRSSYTHRAIQMLLAHGIKTNIHFVLSNSTIDEAISFMEEKMYPAGVNRVIFLIHKPVGLGSSANVLDKNDVRVKYFFSLFNRQEYCDKAGFDSCSAPALLNMAGKVMPESYDTCEGGRFSAYISPDMKLYPCSFDQDGRYAVSLRESSIEDAWMSERFDAFRSRLSSDCPGCADRASCMGGCPLMKEIVLCSRGKKEFMEYNESRCGI